MGFFPFYKSKSLTCFLSAEYSLKHKDFCLGLKSGTLSWCTNPLPSSILPLPTCLTSLPLNPEGIYIWGLKQSKNIWQLQKLDYRLICCPRVWSHLRGLGLSEKGGWGGGFCRQKALCHPGWNKKIKELAFNPVGTAGLAQEMSLNPHFSQSPGWEAQRNSILPQHTFLKKSGTSIYGFDKDTSP